ncbi:hypothetical protein FPV67DRAFT_1783922 [Lyophyllum atratum]|nr:hypothetical protein FPV67DRAFT_1783922 [Lyophyllum atratum]
MPKAFSALPGFYYYFFLYLEPLSTFAPAITCFLYPGTAWFYHGLIPTGIPAPATTVGMEARAIAAVWQLTNSYMLVGLLEYFGFRAVRDSLPNNPEAQERILGASIMALACADMMHVVLTVLAAPADIRFDFANWNAMYHGITTGVAPMLIIRLAWIVGIGRTRYYFGQTSQDRKKKG